MPPPPGNREQGLRIWFIRNDLLATESVLLESEKAVFLRLPCPCGSALANALLARDVRGGSARRGS